LNVTAQSWQPAGDRIKTEWAEQIDPANPLPEYPRPQLERDQWLNLNGLWDYALAERGGNMPAAFEVKSWFRTLSNRAFRAFRKGWERTRNCGTTGLLHSFCLEK
jgi:hypothetical protein